MQSRWLTMVATFATAGCLNPADSSRATRLEQAVNETTEAWTYSFTPGQVLAVAIDGDGDVIHAGWAGFERRGIITKLNGWDGSVSWSRVIDSVVSGVAIDAENVVAVGQSSEGRFAAVKLSGADGSILWHRDIGPEAGSAQDVRIDGSGDLIAVGMLEQKFAIVKVSGDDGREIWRAVVEADEGVAKQLQIDELGNPIVAGQLGPAGGANAFAVLKLSGDDGVEMWRYEATGTPGTSSEALSVALDANNDVAAVGRVSNERLLVKLDGTAGEELWHQGRQSFEYVTFDSAGDVITVGGLLSKWAGESGSPRCTAGLNGTSSQLTLDPNQNVFTVGYDSRFRFQVVKLSAVCEVRWVWSVSSPDHGRARTVAADANGDAIAGGELYDSPGPVGFVVKLNGEWSR